MTSFFVCFGVGVLGKGGGEGEKKRRMRCSISRHGVVLLFIIPFRSFLFVSFDLFLGNREGGERECCPGGFYEGCRQQCAARACCLS